MKNLNPILTIDDLINKLSPNITNSEEINQIIKAYNFCQKKYAGKKRLSGEDYINHPLNVAYILADLNVDYVTIIGALLHETINHTDTTKEELEQKFGEEITKIVVSISKINRLELPDDKDSSKIYLRKVLVGLSEDVRVLFIKLADRLHNMRTVWALEPEKQKHKAQETMDILIPIAHRLGINSIKSELEDLCLRYTKPEIYHDIESRLESTREELNNILEEMKESISEILNDHGISFTIKGRVKSIHSIYKKMDNGKKFNDIYDILALRVFLEKESDCYLAVGLIHSKYRPMPNRFKDYIAMPKSNMYQSLHTTIFGINGYLFEVQLRTYEMDEIAEKGIASHWSYKEKGTVKIQNIMEQKLEMFRNIIDSHNDKESDLEFAQNLESEILNDYIYCFTPKGDVVELPLGSTPIDFAYRIHSRVGDTTIGAIVNDNIVPLDHQLQDGDIVKINTSSTSNPNKEWLKFVKTSQARNKIKSFFSKQDRENYIEKGRQLLEKEIRRQKLSINEILSDSNLKKILKELKMNETDELYLAVGSLRYTASYIISIIQEDKKNVQDILLEKVMLSNHPQEKRNLKKDIIVAGTDDILVTVAKCCKPVFGDPIIGYVTKGQGVSVHKQNCPNIKDLEQRTIPVEWNESASNTYLTDIEIEVENGKNYLADIITKAGLKNIYIESINTKENDITITYQITIKLKNINDLNNYLNELNGLSYVKKAVRVIK